jgi:hypothetical protein
MAEKTKRTEPWQSGQQSNAKGEKGDKVKVKVNMSEARWSGRNGDPLAEAIRGRDSYIPSGMHVFVPSGSVSYSPAGEFGRPVGPKTKASDPMAGALRSGRGTFRGKP